MKMIFLGDAARDSGSLGFSDACPLDSHKYHQFNFAGCGTDHPAQTACTFIRSAMSTISSTLA